MRLRKKVSEDTGHSSVLEKKESKWYGTHTYKPEGKWNEVADLLVDNFKESGHLAFRGMSALNRGILKRESGRSTIHLTAESSNTDFFISHYSLGKSGQYFPSSTELVCRFCSKDSWSDIFAWRQISIDSQRSAARSGFFSTNSEKGLREQWDTACVCIFDHLKHRNQKFNSPKHGNRRDS